MHQLKLNLGRFDQCVEYLSDGQNADYCIDSGMEVSYCMSHDGDIVSTKLAGACINIPIFDIGVCISNGRICDQQMMNLLLSRIELDIFVMIKRILQENNNGLVKLENILIPVRSVKFFDDDKCDGCYGWAEVGIAVIV